MTKDELANFLDSKVKIEEQCKNLVLSRKPFLLEYGWEISKVNFPVTINNEIEVVFVKKNDTWIQYETTLLTVEDLENFGG